MTVITTKNAQGTQRAAALLASEVRGVPLTHARVLALDGEFGTGKTTFVQGFSRALGVAERVTSPTFVLVKMYQLRPAQNNRHFRHLVHIDCYRIDDPQELMHLGLDEIFADPDAIVLIEWAHRIKKVLPDDAISLQFGHGRKPNERTIEIKV